MAAELDQAVTSQENCNRLIFRVMLITRYIGDVHDGDNLTMLVTELLVTVSGF